MSHSHRKELSLPAALRCSVLSNAISDVGWVILFGSSSRWFRPSSGYLELNVVSVGRRRPKRLR